MKARMSAATARQNLPAGTQEAVRAMVDAEFEERQKIYANRILLATCLALNDIAGFGDKRLPYILKGIEDITTDYANRCVKLQGVLSRIYKEILGYWNPDKPLPEQPTLEALAILRMTYTTGQSNTQ